MTRRAMTCPAMTPRRRIWPPHRVERLKVLCADGFSAAEIAKRLRDEGAAGVTRNAVIGKLHRLGLSPSGRAR